MITAESTYWKTLYLQEQNQSFRTIYHLEKKQDSQDNFS